MPPYARHTILAATGLLLALAAPAAGQSTLERSPNLRPAWALSPGALGLRIGHRLELIAGGDQLLNVPTLSAAVGLPWRAAFGLDFTSNSEVVPARTSGNETQVWLGVPVVRRPRGAAELVVAWNSVARSVDAAVTARAARGPLALLAELRGFSDALGTGEAGSAGAVGASLQLTPHLALTGDVGRMFTPDTLGTVWSAAVAVAIPGTPHTLALEVTNGGATTLQGASRPKVIGTESVRYGFVFTIPLGSGRQWGQIFQRGAAREAPAPVADTTVEMRGIALHPTEIRIRAGQTVAWVNRDPVMHTVTADDGSWGRGEFGQGEVFIHRFDRPGRYAYHCTPHPQMRGVVIVEP